MKRTRVAVLGCGYWGKNLVRNFAQLGELGAVCDPSPEGKRLAKEIAPDVPFYEDTREVFENPELSGIAIATPATTHVELCRKALLADKDVFCEKPLALTFEEAQKLERLATERSRILFVGHILEYHPAILKIRSLVAENQLGTISYIYSNRLNLGKIRREENILWSFAPHDVAVILRLMGALPFQVIASGGAYITPNIFDVTVTQMLFDNGVAAHIFVSWLNPFKEQKLVIVGTERMATYDDISKELVLYDQHVDVERGQPIPVRGEGSIIDFPDTEPLQCECMAFLEAMDSRENPLTDAASAVRVLRVLQAAQRSLVTQGTPVALPMS